MRRTSKTPAVQLKSVAVRYQWPKFSDSVCRWSSRSPVRDAVTTSFAAPRATKRRWVRDDKIRRLESVLLLAREPLNSRKLSQYANLADGTEARTLIRRLNEIYDESGRSFCIEEVAGGFQLLTRPKFSTWLRRLNHLAAEIRLSAPTLETLAVVAYRQPVLRADIEAIRGVNCGEILRQLMERDLVRISGRSEELGRPFLYSTTKRFLQLFGLSNLDELPRAESLRRAPIPRPAPDPRLSETVTPPVQSVSENVERVELKLVINE